MQRTRHGLEWSLAADLCVLRTSDGMKKDDLASTDPYYPAWREYGRVTRRSILLTLVLFVVALAFAGALSELIFRSGPDWLWPVAMAPWVIGAIVV